MILLSGCIIESIDILNILPNLLDSSSYAIEEVGKEEFGHDGGRVELGHYLLPDDEFTSRFSSISEIYHFMDWFEHHWSTLSRETWIVVLQYEPSVYEEAKAYCLDTMSLQDIDVPDYGNYRFLQNRKLIDADPNRIMNFPDYFNMFAFNDQDQKLAFMGYNNGYDHGAERERVKNDWGGFLEERFPELWQ